MPLFDPNSGRPSPHALLDELFERLRIDTSRWTTARTSFLSALATPSPRDDGRFDFVVRIQPAATDVEDVAGWGVRLTEEIAGPVAGEIEHSLKVILAGVPEGTHRLQPYKPPSMLPASMRDRLVRDLSLAGAECSRRPEDRLAADGHRTVRAPAFVSTDDNRLVSVAARVDPAGNLTLRLRGVDPRLDGVPVVIRVGPAERRLVVLTSVGDRVETGTTITAGEWHNSPGDVVFSVDDGMSAE